jgi:hypothetical protein
MTDEEFNRQYDAAWANRLITNLEEAEYFRRLPAADLFNALCERMEEQMNIEDSEIGIILDIIADRLGRLEEVDADAEGKEC